MIELREPLPFRHHRHASLIPQVVNSLPTSSMPIGKLEVGAGRRLNMKDKTSDEKLQLPHHKFEDPIARLSVMEALSRIPEPAFA